ncbi:SRPBCC family protein [Conexibacter sp. DBS9H8]|uniref:SRPBCC family protein n=1 Tax=Conexibacter sp. DBS9H8 TaxID=2937801 RepID=UPI00200F097A|nr:SRPBCC family protein [Conexibacter sp. DBS9H8]
MKEHLLIREQYLRQPVAKVFAFFSEARNLERLTPSWLRFEVLEPAPTEIAQGTLIDYRLRVHGIPLKWTSEIETFEPGVRFIDRQLHGPYALWHHTHEFLALGEGTLIRDTVRYGIGFGPFGELARIAQVQRDLDNIFDSRRRAVEEIFA